MTSARVRILVGAGIALAVVLLGFLVVAARSGGTAASGTTVGGVDIGGMSQPEAEQAVTAALGPLGRKKLRVTALDQTFVIKPADAGLSLDAAASVAPAFGQSWNPVDLVGRLLGGHSWPAVAAIDDAALAAQVQSMADAVNILPVEPTLTVDGGSPVLTPGTAGRALDQQAAAEAISGSLLQARAPIQVTVQKVDPSVSTAEAQGAVDLARTAVSAPVTVHADAITATVPSAAVGRALSFTVQDGQLVPQLDGAILHASIRKALKPIEVRGRDATFRIRRGHPVVVASKVGKGVSDDDLATAVSGVLDKPAGQRDVTVSVGVRDPKLTTEQAQQLGVTERLSTFTQYFPYAAYRVQNIGEAARRINGTLLMPGDTFSMNDTIKERTEANGYTVGFVVGEGGIFAEELGGGVSTATTATWTAAFYAGLERVQTVAHSIYISRYKPGLEATVAWGIFDMKFRNDTPHAVFITAGITNGSITVSMWGTKEYDKITAEPGPETGIVPFDTIYDASKTCLGQGGVNGFTIVVDRVFWKNGKEVKREPITSRYKPAPEVICHKKPKPGQDGGTASPSASGSASASGSPSASASGAGRPSPAPASGEPGTGAGPTTFANPSPTPKPTPKPSKPGRG